MKGINREKLYEEMLLRLCEGQKAAEEYKECMFQLSNTEKISIPTDSVGILSNDEYRETLILIINDILKAGANMVAIPFRSGDSPELSYLKITITDDRKEV